MILFIFDNNCSPRLAKGLDYLEEGNSLSPYRAQVKHIRDFIPANSDDDRVIEEVGKQNAFLITYDKDFKEFKQKWEIYKEFNVGVFWWESTKKIIRYWDIVEAFIKNWEEIKHKAHQTAKPFFYQVTKAGISARALKK